MRVRPIDVDEARAVLPTLYDRLRLRDAGAVSRSRTWWEVHLDDGPHFFQTQAGAGPLFHAVVGDEEGLQGYVSYRSLTEPSDGRRIWTVCVEELLASTTAGYAALWRHCLDLGLVTRVSCRRGRTDEPLRWLLADTRGFVTCGEIDHLWLCLLDVPAALATRGYAAAGELVLGVRDAFLPRRVARRRALPCLPFGGGPPWGRRRSLCSHCVASRARGRQGRPGFCLSGKCLLRGAGCRRRG